MPRYPFVRNSLNINSHILLLVDTKKYVYFLVLKFKKI